ncbi:CCG-binding protein 1 [Physcomitrium patens]|uniref:Uncharacterized protein n=1 Tax=Physcomitrium patens TaxID=3218 RepID=A9TH25_PHYPA|nr:CCG-binding protein 1-like [Physcomitrium patens]XP_024376637.1 CCG-binding protein 1-like [Physcomitrium patens]XP_024376638.1 CCG-binding protein 1-like [Physcomitrium patens]XP_024376639.1 CCG-binding protein 1-like [Physcomitrium patens]PNR54577.1 hypothetical protein PHYPA_008254 [Physcomitrium patens]|eukprot:XP_024376636.1 CCG-binding protein 1-like [Physcomitrella patens]
MMAPFIAVPLHAVAPQAQAQKHQVTSLNGKLVMALNPGSSSSGSSRGMVSSLTSEGVQINGCHGQNIPKLGSFNKSFLSHLMSQPSLLENAEYALAECCTHLDIGEAYSCWEAVSEFEDIKVDRGVPTDDEHARACCPLKRFENLVRQSGDVSGLIGNIRLVAKTATKQSRSKEVVRTIAERPVFVDDGGLPQDPNADASPSLLPESTLARLLRFNSFSPPWFTRRNDHEID